MGKMQQKVAPGPSLFGLAHSRPPWFSTMETLDLPVRLEHGDERRNALRDQPKHLAGGQVRSQSLNGLEDERTGTRSIRLLLGCLAW
jgi:hypothetical protein